MNKQYILIRPLTLEELKLETVEEMREAANEFGLGLYNTPGTNYYFLTGTFLPALSQAMTTLDLQGVIVEVASFII